MYFTVISVSIQNEIRFLKIISLQKEYLVSTVQKAWCGQDVTQRPVRLGAGTDRLRGIRSLTTGLQEP